ncbi:MAG: hypothetical protein GWO20_20105, partial [Candidatus Korarchaeota archaeon]|nr:hypothetical protein [Candidatus Korarchaeota archaeon]NIU85539.1 hypothetical protein [Candidatus Thorarchaeota archaeon]NIW15650.1 hypothetical protein [Candidatus Thorarchaeota archaeon]NIW53580.1 hypothetical protein [Candidatus Korarchaeota archaeon]
YYGVNSSLNVVNATYNYWGDPTGPGGEGPGTGDNITENVLYLPWLKAPYPQYPYVHILNPREGAVVSTMTVTIEWYADAVPEIYEYLVKIDDGDWQFAGGTDLTLNDLTDAEHTVHVKVITVEGKTGVDSVTFRAEDLLAQISQRLDDINNTLYGKIQDLLSTVNRMNATLYDRTTEILDAVSSVNETVLSQTVELLTRIDVVNATLYEKQVDLLNTIYEVNATLYTQVVSILIGVEDVSATVYEKTVDILTAIGATVTSPVSGEVLTTDTVTVEWAGITVPNIVVSYAVRLDDDAWQPVGDDTKYTFSNVADGQHNVTVKGVNTVGNEVQMSVTFNVSTGAGGLSTTLIAGIGGIVTVVVVAVAIYFLKIRKGAATTG